MPASRSLTRCFVAFRLGKIVALPLIELLVVIAIIAILIGLYCPPCRKCMAAASRRTISGSCARGAQLHDTNHAFRRSPLRMEHADYTTQFWYGLVTYDSSTFQVVATDQTRGILTNYYENNTAVAKCPQVEAYPIAATVGGLSRGYAYNRHAAGQKLATLPTSQVFLFTEQVQLNTDGTLMEVFDSFGSPSEPNPFGGTHAYTAFGANVTHFRFAGVANVAFADGHAETRRPVDAPSVAPFPQSVWDAAKVKFGLGFLAENNLPYTGR